ncbi:MAG: DUF1294 domain-containing protein [Clostridia bacterium]|jgi:uncharacterized membrane protein YsdA (DUF1294 family)|nr:DUF1294 domain-containing protein [Clostridia bacterium]
MFEDVLTINQILSQQNITIYLIIINIIGFFIMFIDKKKAQNGSFRISEKTLFIVTLLGGGIGSILGMYTFRHKTKKLRFTIGFPIIVFIEISVIIYLFFIK